MRLKLKTSKDNLPSGCEFREPKTGKVFNAYEHGILNTVSQIMEHRLANPGLFPDKQNELFRPTSIVQELYRSAAAKRPDLFVETEGVSLGKLTVEERKPTTACACGRQDYEAEFCATCGGKRQVGWKCRFCGLVRGG